MNSRRQQTVQAALGFQALRLMKHEEVYAIQNLSGCTVAFRRGLRQRAEALCKRSPLAHGFGECGFDENSGKSLTGSLIGTDSAHKKTDSLLCQEYVLESQRIIYRIPSQEDKHPVLLPGGEKAQFRMNKDKLMLRVEDMDDKERE